MIAALQRLSEHSVGFETRLLLPNDGPPYRVITGVSWSCPAEQRGEAIVIVEHSLRSAPDEKLVAALYRLRTLTRGRAERSSADQEGEMLIWAEQLRCWPGDAALDVIRNWPSRENGQWWPTWHEVEAAIKQRCEKRIAIANLLRRSVPGLMIESKVDPLGAAASQEERERAFERWKQDLRPAIEDKPSEAETRAAALKRLDELDHEYRQVRRERGLPPLTDDMRRILEPSAQEDGSA